MSRMNRLLIKQESDLIRNPSINESKTNNVNHSILFKITTCAILMALGATLKVFGIMITTNMRISFFAIPLILAGLLHGFGFGIVTSIGADLVYSLFSGYAFNPAFTLSAVYWGILGGAFHYFVKKKGNLPLLIIIVGVFITSMLETHTNLIVTYILYGTGTTMVQLFTKYLILLIKWPLIVLVIKLLYERLFKQLIKGDAKLWVQKN